jgi:hypothetical protein
VEAIAAFVVARSRIYEGKVNTKGRVFYIREMDPRPEMLWVPNLGYWEGRACIKYAADLRNMPELVKQKELVDLGIRC